jgi:hypothetical protein
MRENEALGGGEFNLKTGVQPRMDTKKHESECLMGFKNKENPPGFASRRVQPNQEPPLFLFLRRSGGNRTSGEIWEFRRARLQFIHMHNTQLFRSDIA